jgi:hypothetical protein
LAGAGPLLERADALRDGRGGDAKFGRRRVKAAAPVDGGQGGKLGVVAHQPRIIGNGIIDWTDPLIPVKTQAPKGDPQCPPFTT